MSASRAGRLKAALGQIDELIQSGRLGEAEALARRAAAEHPLSAPAHFALGFIERRRAQTGARQTRDEIREFITLLLCGNEILYIE